MSAPSLKPDQPTSRQHTSGRSVKHNLGKLAGTLALITSGLGALIIGIAIGNAARKRIDRWAHAYS